MAPHDFDGGRQDQPGASGSPDAPGSPDPSDLPGASESAGASGSPGPLPVRVFRVFAAPGRLFAALRHDPRWLGALLLGAALVVASTVLVPGEIWEEMFRSQMLQAGQEMPEGLDLGTIQRVAAVVGGAVFWFVWVFFLAGVLALVFGFVLGDDGRYRQYLAVTAHALLISGLGGLATVPLRILRRDPQLTLNLGLFFDLGPGYLASFLTTLDLFLLWSYVVMAVGVHEIDPRRSWGSATAILLTLALLVAAGLAFLIPG